MFVVDPGHPNQSLNPDSDGYGAVYEGEDRRIEEKNLTWDVSEKIQNLAREHDERIELTRDKNEPVSLSERCEITNQFKPEAFVSIHFNWFRNQSARGSTIFHYPGSEYGIKLANEIGLYFKGFTTIPHRRIRATDDIRDDDLTPYLYVLSNTNCPAVLLELAFLSNSKDRKQITNDRGRFTSHYATIIFYAMRNYDLKYVETISPTKEEVM